ncbi:hypothetical protein ACLJJ6_06005 [Pediococcus siamensis]|uniref:hypothetical protein n=1 Tax=Pediococcus siamensis TaxID=381829 RepID=UPI0039A162F2
MKTTEFIKKIEMLNTTRVVRSDQSLTLKRGSQTVAMISREKAFNFTVYAKVPRRLLNLIVDYATTEITARGRLT